MRGEDPSASLINLFYIAFYPLALAGHGRPGADHSPDDYEQRSASFPLNIGRKSSTEREELHKHPRLPNWAVSADIT
jgi:hypothetical protein